MNLIRTLRIAAALVLATGALSAAAQTKLDHNRALAGIDADDTPGYPIMISKPGTYVLTGNLTAPANTSAIFVYASDVTIDLGGFTISGTVGCSITASGTACNGVPNSVADGITTTGATNLTVRNGTVRGFDRHGIRLGFSGSVSDVTVRSNSGHGLSVGVGGNPALVQVDRVIADGNGGAGVYSASGGRFERIVSRYNGSHGLQSAGGAWATMTSGLLSVGNGGVGAAGTALHASVLSSNKGGTVSGVISQGGNVANGASF